VSAYTVSAARGESDPAVLDAAVEVRRAVFVEEQGVAEAEEMDGEDAAAWHVVLTDRATARHAGTTRVREVDGVAKVERVAVRSRYRGRGLGRRLMGLAESYARTRGHDEAVLHAQTAVEGFYAALGYERVGGEFPEAGIPHVEMRKRL
jgi:predicted GNAT family N-acyltransferase